MGGIRLGSMLRHVQTSDSQTFYGPYLNSHQLQTRGRGFCFPSFLATSFRDPKVDDEHVGDSWFHDIMWPLPPLKKRNEIIR